MGSGSWTSKDFVTYSCSVGRSVNTDGTLNANYTTQDIFHARRLQPELNPYNVVRECCDTPEHPSTVPVILAFDVTGSMGSAPTEIAKKLNEVMTTLYDSVTDVEFCVMGIGDFAYDDAPTQASQFESDIRIAEQLDKIYVERGGGGNDYESYTSAWYFGIRHTSLDCWKRGKKGIIITMGDEPINPYLPAKRITEVFGDNVQGNIETPNLYKEACEKFDIYHLLIDDESTSYKYYNTNGRLDKSWGEYLDNEHLLTVGLNNLASTIVKIVTSSANKETVFSNNNEISW